MWCWFQKEFVRLVLPASKYRTLHTEQLLSSYVTVNDEAFVVWMYTNNYDRWKDMYEKGNYKTSSVPSKWTNSGSVKKDGRTKKYSGVAPEGIRKFNEIVKTISANRKKSTYRNAEKELLQEYKKENDVLIGFFKKAYGGFIKFVL